MNKFNHLGNELVELKRELLHSHSKIILKSLNQLVEQMLSQNMIDHTTHQYLKNSDYSLAQFQDFCLTQSNYCLSQEELLKIYDKKRRELVDYLNRSVEAFQLTSKSFLKEEEVVIVKTFSFNREMTCQFFGVDERFCENLYGRKRFVEKFVAMRYKKILMDFIANYPLEKVPFKIDRTPVFFDETNESYEIEFLIKFKLDALENLEEQNFVEHVHVLVSDLIRYVNRSMGMNVPVKPNNNHKKHKHSQPTKPISAVQKEEKLNPSNKTNNSNESNETNESDRKMSDFRKEALKSFAPETKEVFTPKIKEENLTPEINTSDSDLTLVNDSVNDSIDETINAVDDTTYSNDLESELSELVLSEDIESDLNLELESLMDEIDIDLDDINNLI